MGKVFDMRGPHAYSSTTAEGAPVGACAVAIGIVITTIIADGEKGGAAASP